MKGILYGIGVGPGDPELMTLKAVKRIIACPVAAIPHKDKERCAAYQIARQAVPEIEEKTLLCVDVPMTKDKEIRDRSYQAGVSSLKAELELGHDVALLTLGDPAIYASCMYLMEEIRILGYETVMLSGIPSFCAAAARLNLPLVQRAEELHILPASYQIEEGLKLPGVKVLMKAGSQMAQVKRILSQANVEAVMVENCGMPGEKLYGSLDEMPEDAGYYSLIIVRNLD